MNTTQLKYILLILYLICSFDLTSQTNTEKEIIYFIPGQGSDERLFKNLHLDTAKFEVHYIKYEIPCKGEKMSAYASRLSQQIDTTKDFTLIGVSLGGMISTEMTRFLHPKNVIIISSAKSRNELPAHYKFQRWIPIYKIVPKRMIKFSALLLQPIVEPDRKKEAQTCKMMLKDKEPIFLKRTIGMIITWERESSDTNIVHIHGNHDHTLPIKNVNYDILIEDGSHMMMLTRTEEIKSLILAIINTEIKTD
jgi:pimeloyl-ACP methyl ester carboxylesterase